MFQQSETDIHNLYQALHIAVPGACIFTSVSVPSSESELDPNIPTVRVRPETQPDPSNDLLIDALDDAAAVTTTLINQPDSVLIDTLDDASAVAAILVDQLDSMLIDALDDASAVTGTLLDHPDSVLIDTLDDASVLVSGSQPDPVNDVPDNASGPSWMANNPGNNVAEDSGNYDCNIPAPLTALYQSDYKLINDSELLIEAERLFCELTISDSEASAIKEATVAQHDCVAWKEQRKGRLTASLFHDVFVRKPTTDPVPLLKKVMGYEQSDLGHIPSIRWGVQNENDAREKIDVSRT